MAEKRTYIDMIGREVKIPNRSGLTVISLVPSQTELLYDLGLGEQIVGQTRFCIHPAHEYNSEKFVGGTKKLDLDKIKILNPDLIIANKEENDQDQIVELMNLFPVWVSNVSSLDDNQRMITELGEIFGVTGQASWINQQISIGFHLLKAKNKISQTCLYLIWRNPYMTIGTDTFVHEILELGGFKNVVKDKRYPEIALDQMVKLEPDYVFLSSEPYPFKQKHMEELRVSLPKSKIVLVDGELFSWYGSRLAKTPAYLLNLKSLNYA